MKIASRLVPFVFACLLALPSLLSFQPDPDLWFHLKIGLEHLHCGNLPVVDHFSYGTLRSLWISHEWLSRILLAISYDYLGDAGLLILRGLLIIMIAWVLLFSSFRLLSNRGISAILFVYYFQFISPFLNIRTQLFAFLLFIVSLALLEVSKQKHQKSLFLFPVIAIIWANMHGSFVLLFLILACGLLDMLWRRAGLRELTLLILVLLVSVIVTLVNPFGISLHAFVLEQTFSSTNHLNVSEWKYIDAAHFPYFLMLVCVPALLLVICRASFNKVLYFLFILTGMATCSAMRFFPFFAAVSFLLSSQLLGLILKNVSECELKRLIVAMNSIVILSFIAVLPLLLSFSKIRSQFGQMSGFLSADPSLYPVNAVKYLRDNTPGGRVALPLFWGGYAIWELGDAFKVSIDGRNITLYDPTYVNSVVSGYKNGDMNEFLSAKEPADFVLLRLNSPLSDSFLNSSAWHLLYSDSTSIMFVRN